MKSNRIACFFVVVIAVFLGFQGCATVELNKMTPAQEDAICRLSGNALAETLKLVKPDYVAPAKLFCQTFVKASNLIEAQTILENTLTYLSGQYAEGERLGRVLFNVLTIIGIDEKQATGLLFSKMDEAIKIQGFTQDMWRKANLVVSGFCQML